MHAMSPFALRRPLLAPAFTLALLAACGGDGGDAGSAPPDATPTATLAAVGSSSRTVSLAWAPQAAAVSVERAGAGGIWSSVTSLPAGARAWLDDGLAAATAYEYRLKTADGGVLARAQATTAAAGASAVVTAVATPGAELARAVIGNAGGRVASADGAAAVDVPAGAFAGATTLRLESISNHAPSGDGDGVRVVADALPAKPLKLSLGGAGGGLRLAVQRADGSWLALPSEATAGAALLAELPAPALTAGPTAGLIAGSTAGLAAASTVYDLQAVRFRDLYLAPRTSTVAVNGSRLLVPYAHTEGRDIECAPPPVGCVISPVLEARELPLLNQKDGYQREWRVEGVVGGAPAIGTIAPRASFGAVYTAPRRAPATNPVTVSIRSTHVASGRGAELSATVQVREPRWTGRVAGYLGAADLAFTFSAQAVWTLTGEDDHFEAQGEQTLGIVEIHCQATASPASVTLQPGLLKVDRSTTPPTYTLDVGAFWDTVITGTCPGQPGQAVIPWRVPGQLQVSGSVGGDGTRIEGRSTANGIEWDWSISSEL